MSNLTMMLIFAAASWLRGRLSSLTILSNLQLMIHKMKTTASNLYYPLRTPQIHLLSLCHNPIHHNLVHLKLSLHSEHHPLEMPLLQFAQKYRGSLRS